MKPVDLTNLREITDGDLAVERELFREFLISSSECIKALRSSYSDDRAEEWRRQAHALKGSSLNLGAMQLGHLCKEAQDNYQATPEKKQALLAIIEGELGRVKQFLDDPQA